MPLVALLWVRNQPIVSRTAADFRDRRQETPLTRTDVSRQNPGIDSSYAWMRLAISMLLAMRRTDEQMAEISQACRDMGDAASLQERTRADTRFHLAILRASGNDLLVPLGVLIESAFDHLFTYTTRAVDDLNHAQKLHEAIEKNIRLQRPDAARAAVRKLLANTDGVIRSR